MEINFKGKKIFYTDAGSGNTLVLIHGFTESLGIWDYFFAVLSKSCRVICIDLPGHGKSQCISDIHTMDLMAEAVKAVLDQAAVQKCVIIGHSMGGYVTLGIAEKYPELLDGFGLFHSSALPDTEEGKINRTRAIEIIRQGHLEFLSSFIPDLFTEENRIKYSCEVEKLVSTAKNMTKEAVIAAQEGMKIRPDRRHVLENTNLPVLFIVGQKDSRIPFAKVMEQIALPPVAQVLVLKNTAHMGYIEATEETLHAVKSFFKGIYIE
jgi:pimeloyl-ACP methyl ester carboxylesterase